MYCDFKSYALNRLASLPNDALKREEKVESPGIKKCASELRDPRILC